MNDPITMNGLFAAEYFDMESSHVNDTLRIFVGKPETVDAEQRYPAIFTLDGNASFASLTGTQRMLTQGGEVPVSFVIGIGYPGNTLWESMQSRNRDYAPSDPGQAETMALGTNSKAGATNFLRFIEEELKPLLRRRYPIDENNMTLQGISLGGLFAAWVLLTQPQCFRHYILGSPAIWWRKEQIWEWEESYARHHSDLSARVFVAAGALETKEHLRSDARRIAEKNPALREYVSRMIDWNDQDGWPEVAKLVPSFVQRLQSRNYPGLAVHAHVFADENHMSVAAAATSRGLRYVFGSWQP